MIRTYRMWRYVRIVETDILGSDTTRQETTSKFVMGEFAKRKTLFGRNYTIPEAAMAYVMANKKGYINVNTQDILQDQVISLTGEGMSFSVISGLLSAEAKIIAPISATTGVLIAGFALYISFTHKDQTQPIFKPVITIEK